MQAGDQHVRTILCDEPTLLSYNFDGMLAAALISDMSKNKLLIVLISCEIPARVFPLVSNRHALTLVQNLICYRSLLTISHS